MSFLIQVKGESKGRTKKVTLVIQTREIVMSILKGGVPLLTDEFKWMGRRRGKS